MPTSYYCVDFEPMGKHVAVRSGTDLLDATCQAGITLHSGCGGQGDCGQCRIVILEGQSSPPNEYEEEALTEIELQKGHRLACHVKVRSAMKIFILSASIASKPCFETEDQNAFALVGEPV